MSFQSFVPQVWEAMILKNLNNEHVYAQCCNRDYEGDISDMGASVRITAIGRVTISNYTRNSTLSAPEALNLAGQDLLIDQGKTFNFEIDDVDKRQARGSVMSNAMVEASWGLADATDTFLGTTMSNGAGLTVTAQTVGTAAGEKSAYDNLVAMDVALTETNTPRGDRYAIVPPWFEGMLRLDERFISFGTDPSNARLKGTPIGMASNFTIYLSNNCPTSGAATVVVSGYKGAVTFAEQISKTEAYRPPDRFADAVKGLHIYGAKVVRPNNLAKFLATRGTLAA